MGSISIVPNVQIRYTNGTRMTQEVMGKTDFENPNVTTSKSGDIVTIDSTEELWQPPLLALKDINGTYTLCNVTEVATNQWECNLSGQDIASIRTAGIDTSYNLGVADLEVSEIDIQDPTESNPVYVVYEQNITINFTLLCLGVCPLTGVVFEEAEIGGVNAQNTTTPTYDSGYWLVNVSVPDLPTGINYNLTLIASHPDIENRTDTEVNAVHYNSTNTCSCPATPNTDWTINMSDYCNITSDCDLGTGRLNFTEDPGWANLSAKVETTGLGFPPISSTLWFWNSSAKLFISTILSFF